MVLSREGELARIADQLEDLNQTMKELTEAAMATAAHLRIMTHILTPIEERIQDK